MWYIEYIEPHSYIMCTYACTCREPKWYIVYIELQKITVGRYDTYNYVEPHWSTESSKFRLQASGWHNQDIFSFNNYCVRACRSIFWTCPVFDKQDKTYYCVIITIPTYLWHRFSHFRFLSFLFIFILITFSKHINFSNLLVIHTVCFLKTFCQCGMAIDSAAIKTAGPNGCQAETDVRYILNVIYAQP